MLSNPKATNPRIETKTSNLPKIRYRIVSQRLCVALIRILESEGHRCYAHEASEEFDMLDVRGPLPERHGACRQAKVPRTQGWPEPDTDVE